MARLKDGSFHQLTITNTKEVSTIYHEDSSDYIHGSLTCEGGAAFHKGVSVGMQEKMNSGLLLYDEENFYGFSDKYGLILLSNNCEYRELEIEEIKNSALRPSNPQEKTKSIEQKNIQLNLFVKDNPNFYIIIPENYNELVKLHFIIQYIINDETMLSRVNLIIFNHRNQNIQVTHQGNQIYLDEHYNINENKKQALKFTIDIISNQYILISKKSFLTQS